MEKLKEFIKEIRDNTYDNELAYIYIEGTFRKRERIWLIFKFL